METEGGGPAAAGSPVPAPGLKRSPSSSTSPDGGGDSFNCTTSDVEDWLTSGSEEDENEDEDDENQGACRPFIVDIFPRVSYDHFEQSQLPYNIPETKFRGPSPQMLFPAFKNDDHAFGSDYNLGDKSEISFSNVEDCSDKCDCYPMFLLQFIDVKIAGYRHTQPGQAKIFGFLAARDTVNHLRNYVYRREVDNFEFVSVKQKTGVARLSLTSPARVISMVSRALIEFELHVIREDENNGDEDCLIIEGCTELHTMLRRSRPFIEHIRLYGGRCALDVKYAALFRAVEAQVSVEVFNCAPAAYLKLYAKTSGFGDVIRLFRGMLPEVGFRLRFAVAVEMRSDLELYMEGSSSSKDGPVLDQNLLPCRLSRERSFRSCFHGTVGYVVELGDLGVISVNVTWRSYEKRNR